jgi:Zinc carboxypeptidase
MNYQKIFEENKEEKLFGRYIHLDHIEPLLNKFREKNQVQIIGKSVQEKPIYGLEVGRGKTKILIWSQMHGDESTTTKALFDLLNLLSKNTDFGTKILENFTLYIIPILNPDGAQLYTRENANKIDLNRDAQNLSQPESKILRTIYNQFQPDFCYNMHDQRTIYAIANTNKPATVSFLAPSYNQEREINNVRKKAIAIITEMNLVLQEFIPNQVGRFDDGFNLNCVGDTFQNLGTPTILFESGHFQGDYQREQTRKFIFMALLASFLAITENLFSEDRIHEYMNIPQNNPAFFDIVYKNVSIYYDNSKNLANIAIQYKEELIENAIHFNAYIAKVGELKGIFGHVEIDANQKKYTDGLTNQPNEDQEATFMLDDLQVVNGLIVK